MILDFLFPPLCLICRSRTEVPFFCSACWEHCSPIDPIGQCRHCFKEEEREDLCPRCRRGTWLPFRRAVVFDAFAGPKILCRKGEAEALAGFLAVQWIQLDWPLPHVVIPMPGMEKVAQAFTDFFRGKVSYANLLTRWRGKWKCEGGILKEEQVLLLLDFQTSLSVLKDVGYCLAEAFPKKIFQLSLLNDDYPPLS